MIRSNKQLVLVMAMTLAISLAAVSAAMCYTTGMVGQWKMDEGSGTFIADSSPNSNDGVLLDPLDRTTWIAAPTGVGLQFDPGTADGEYDPNPNPYISVSNAGGQFQHAGGFTVMSWMNIGTYGWDTGSGYGHTIISQGLINNQPDGWMLKRRGGTSKQMAFRVGGTRLTTDINLAHDTWYHITGTFDADTGAVRMYVHNADGSLWIQKSGTATGIINNLNDLNIARLDPNYDNPPSNFQTGWGACPNKDAQGFWRGGLADVRYYDHALTLGDVESVVPEPSSLLALATGFVGMAGFALRRRRS